MRYPVIHISFGRGIVTSGAVLGQRFRAMLDEVAERYAIVLLQQDLANRFAELIQRLHQTYQQKVVVLVDEYEKPILDNIENPEQAIAVREGLRNIYSVIKDCDRILSLPS